MDKEKKQRGIKIERKKPRRAPNYSEWVSEPLQNEIRAGLEARDWSPADLARALSTQGSLISRWMMGARPSPESLSAIAQALGLDIMRLLVLAEYVPESALPPQDDPQLVMLFNKLREFEMTDERFKMLNTIFETWRTSGDDEGGRVTTKARPQKPAAPAVLRKKTA